MPENSGENTLTRGQVMDGDDMQALHGIFNGFVKEYIDKPEKQTDEEWLRSRLLTELPELSPDFAARQSREAIEAIQVYDKNLAELLQGRRQGKTFTEWFTAQVRKSSTGKKNSEVAARLTILYSSVEETAVPVQEEAAQNQTLPSPEESLEWTDAELSQLAKMTGRQLVQAGARSVVQFTEYDPEYETEKSVKIEEAVALALTTGRDTGLKAAAAGALAVAAKRQVIQVVHEEVPVAAYANIACMSVENAKTAVQVADHKITEAEAGGRMIANFLTAATSTVCETAGAMLGTIAFSEIPFIAPLAGKLGAKLGKQVAKAAGTQIEAKVRKANGPIANSVKRMVKKAGDTVVTTKNKVVNKIKVLKSSLEKKLFG